MPYLISNTQALGEFSTIEVVDDAFICDGISIPFSISNNAVIADYILSDKPVFDDYSETIIEGNPIKINDSLYQQSWNIVPLEGEVLAQAQAQKIEDQKVKIKTDIELLEDSVTPRRQREAILKTDNGWLDEVESKINALRTQLAECNN
jgi:hypothetical protein